MGGLRRDSDRWELVKDGVEAGSGDKNDAFERGLFTSEGKWKGGEGKAGEPNEYQANPLLSVNITEG